MFLSKNTEIHLIFPEILQPTEDIFEERVLQVEGDLLREGVWRHPIIAHEGSAFVMDGHHRLAVAHRQRLKFIPTVFLTYTDVDVEAWRPEEIVTPSKIFEMVRSGKRFPFKTTRHMPKVNVPSCCIELEKLRAF